MNRLKARLFGNFCVAFGTAFVATAVVTGNEMTGILAGVICGVMQGVISMGTELKSYGTAVENRTKPKNETSVLSVF